MRTADQNMAAYNQSPLGLHIMASHEGNTSLRALQKMMLKFDLKLLKICQQALEKEQRQQQNLFRNLEVELAIKNHKQLDRTPCFSIVTEKPFYSKTMTVPNAFFGKRKIGELILRA